LTNRGRETPRAPAAADAVADGRRRRLFVGFYAVSGAAALVYELTWTRLLTLQMGHTVAAVSTVLAAFMGGLAIGAALAGRFPVRQSRRLQTYAVLEGLVALVAIALPTILRTSLPATAWAYSDGDTPFRFALVRATLSLGLLAVPVAAMGATFPIAAAWMAALAPTSGRGFPRKAAVDAGVLYAANTAGAALGAIGAGFWLIPAVGLRGTTWIGVGLSAVSALGVILLSRGNVTAASGLPRSGNGRISTRTPPRLSHVPMPAIKPRPVLACAAAALSGFSALAYEVAFTRLLVLVIGPTTYAFATTAASFISGIALGSAAGTRLARRTAQPMLWLAGTLVATAVSALLIAGYVASRLPLQVASEVAAVDATFETVVTRQAWTVAVLMLPMTFGLGAAFSLALAAATSGCATVERDTARVYVANTIGAIAGALTAGFVVLPWLGLHATFVATSRVGAIAGVTLAAAVWWPRTRGRLPRAAAVALAAGCGVFASLVPVPGWDRNLLASGAYKYAPYIAAATADDFEASLRAGRLEYYKEGAAATVSVRRLGGTLTLAIDGKVDASNAGDMLTQRLLGVLPVLMHRDPQDLCVIGLGSGVTVGSALATGLVHRAQVVEISPEVVEASALFAKENGDVLRMPALRLVVGDGRSHLLLTTRRYDVIVSEPSNPWMAGVAALFTREFFEAARARLEPDGLFCQWAHTYDISDADLRSIVHTFASVFPQGTMWLVGSGDLLLIGTPGADFELDQRLARIVERSRAASIAAVLADVAVAPADASFALLSLFAGGPAELAGYGAGAAVQTDDRMALEFTGPRWIYGRSTRTRENAAMLRTIASDHLPPAVAAALRRADASAWRARGTMEMKAEAYGPAYDSFRRAVALDARDVAALRGASDAATGGHRQTEAEAWLQGLSDAAPANTALQIELSRVLAARGAFDRAIAAASEAHRLEPGSPGPAEQLASIFADMGDLERLRPLSDSLVSRYPERADSWYYHATALVLGGRGAEAVDELRRLLAANPLHARAQNLLGAACGGAGQRACAEAAFLASIRLNPRDPSPYVNLGLLYLQTARPADAADSFAEALALDPTSDAARNGFAEARAARSLR
jgi:spermidine synthase